MTKKIPAQAPKTICVFCSSSDAVDPQYFKAAKKLGEAIAERNYTLVYGGSNIGLMGELARTAAGKGGRVIGIIPKLIKNMVPALDAKHKLIVTEDLRHRKTLMEAESDAFVALPGGFGTLEELMEILTLKQLKYHSKPIVLLNTRGFYDPLIHLFEEFFKKKFAKHKYRELYYVTKSVDDLFSHIENTLK